METYYFVLGFVAGFLVAFAIRRGKIVISRREVTEYNCHKHGWVRLEKYFSPAQMDIMKKQDTFICPKCVKERQQANLR